jgi:hypothetical protein
MNLETITHLLALAAALEDEGQLNNAKLLRAATDSLLTRAARQFDLPKDKATLLAETDRAIESLSVLSVGSELMGGLNRARTAFAEGRLTRYVEIPDPYVCRTCGYLTLLATAVCPVCGAHPDTFNHIRPIYWLEALEPYAALEHLRSTPEKLVLLLAGVTDSQANRAPDEGGWSLRQAIAHLRDAQEVLAFRVNLILDQENPLLESKAVFEWATNETERPAAVGEILETYRASRRQTIARLENLPFTDWWRRGRHEEFGELRLYQQVSYFTCHELIHLPQLESLAHQAT